MSETDRTTAIVPAPELTLDTLTDIEPEDIHPAAAYLRHLQPSGRRTMTAALKRIVDMLDVNNHFKKADRDRYRNRYLYLPWETMRQRHTEEIRNRLQAEVIAGETAAATANKMLAALRGVLTYARKQGKMTAEDYMAAVDIDPVKGARELAGRDISAGEMLALVAACSDDETPAGTRDAAIIGMLYVGGMRRDELVRLELADVDADAGRVAIRHAKGGKARAVFVTNGALAALQDWIAIRGTEPGPLFMPINRAGRLYRRAMTSQAVYNMLRTRGQQANVPDFSPHDFRRTFVGDLLERGVDIATVSRMAGHEHIQTTAKYDRRPEAARKAAAGQLHYPYRRKVRP